jgi:hypothetical protein
MLRARTTSVSFSSCSVGQCRHRRHLQALERLLPLLSRDRAGAERVEIVGQQDRRGFGEPEDAPFARHVLERHDEHARRLRRLRRLRMSGNGEDRGNGDGKEENG